MNSHLVIAIAFQLLLLGYHQVTTLVDFFPFNGVRFNKGWEKTAEVISNGVMMVLPPIGFIFHLRGLRTYAAVYYVVLFIGEIWTWWKPYFFGASERGQKYYDKVFAQTIHIFPPRGKNPRPNLEHTILMGLTFVTAVITLRAYLNIR